MSDTTPGMSRRTALKALAVAPVVIGAFGCARADVDRAARWVRQLGQRGTEAAPYAPTFFTPHEWRTVSVLVDHIIPRDGRSGSATDARVPEFMDVFLTDPSVSAELPLIIRGGLGWLDGESQKRFGTTFIDAGDVHQRQVLDDIAWPAKARPEMSHGVAFFNAFRDFTASGFWSSEVGFNDLQYRGHVFVPEWKGCPDAALQKLGVSYDLLQHRVTPA